MGAQHFALLGLCALAGSLRAARGRRWAPILAGLISSLVLSLIVRAGIRWSLPALATAAHAAYPATRIHMVWVSCGHRGARRIALGYALAAVAIGASYSEAWRAPWLYEGALTATRWAAALLVTYAWASEKNERPGVSRAFRPSGQPSQVSEAPLFLGDFGGACRFGAPLPSDDAARRTRADDSTARSRINGPRAVALILGGGHALGVVGAWAAANPWRDWYLARGLTWAEYAVCALVMACELRRKR